MTNLFLKKEKWKEKKERKEKKRKEKKEKIAKTIQSGKNNLFSKQSQDSMLKNEVESLPHTICKY